MSTGRNEPCPCGSGKKYKQCCLGKAAPGDSARAKQVIVASIVILIAAVMTAFAVSTPAGLAVGVIGLGAVGIWLWLFAPPPKRSGGADPSAINYGR